MSDAMKTHELDLLGELPKLTPPTISSRTSNTLRFMNSRLRTIGGR